MNLKVESIEVLVKVKSLIWLKAIEDGGCRPNTSSKQVVWKNNTWETPTCHYGNKSQWHS